mgnify:CR=1 FL=1
MEAKLVIWEMKASAVSQLQKPYKERVAQELTTPRTEKKIDKKRLALLRENFGTLLDAQTILALADQTMMVFNALVTLRETATALLLVHEALFYSCRL